MSISIAIVGSGPAGFYAAEAVCKKVPEAEVDLIDRLPTPFGLVRSGVAPDHQGTKNVWRVFDRTARRDQLRYFGNVEVGRDVSVEELRARYDAVILAIGAPMDRALGIPGDDLPGVYRSSSITHWYNGHPDYAGEAPVLGSRIAVIGNGNVAVDVVRVLARRREEMQKTDLTDAAADAIAAAKITELSMIGRRGPAEASFTPVELRELGDMEGCVAWVEAGELPDSVTADDPKQQKLKEKILETLRGYSRNDPKSKPARLWIRFYAAPVEIRGEGKVEALVLARTRVEGGRCVLTEEREVVPVDTVVSCIGYDARPLAGVPLSPWKSSYQNEEGRIDEGLWAVGWAKRGPSGVIATNRKDSIDVVDRMLEELSSAETLHQRPDFGRAGLLALLKERGVRVTGYEEWDRIDARERAMAEERGFGAQRVKLTSMESLLQAAEENS